jgi:hypothetical protein
MLIPYLIIGALVGAATYVIRKRIGSHPEALWLHIVLALMAWPLLVLAWVIGPIMAANDMHLRSGGQITMKEIVARLLNKGGA